VALVTNGVKLHSGPMYGVGGVNAQSAMRACWLKPGARRNFAFGAESVASVTNRSAVPEGYLPPYCWELPQKSGAIASRYRAVGVGGVSSSNLAGGRNAEAEVTGSGAISNADAMMLYFAFADLIGLGMTAPNLTAIASAAASSSGNGNVGSAELLAAISASASLLGSGDISAALGLITSAVAGLSGGGDLVSDLIGGVVAMADLSASGDLSADIFGIFEAAANITASGSISVSDLQALAHMVAEATGSGGAQGNISASGELSSALDVTGGRLTVASVASAVWDAVADGAFTYAELVRILAAVSAGKTTIADNGDGTATVTFRDISDTRDRIVAEMDGSERVSITADGD